MSDAHPLAQRKTLEQWESWVDRAISEARERGEFDNLPGRGKPLRLEDSPFADGREVGYGILKNAGFAPYWVEVNKEISAAADQLDIVRNRATQIAIELRSLSTHAQPGAEPAPKRRWWQIFRYVEPANLGSSERLAEELHAELSRLRRDYLAQTDELNQKIVHYNASIPRDLWRLERQVRSVADAEQDFDEAIR